MGWVFGIFALIVAGALFEDVHNKWHKREMVKAKHFKDTIYA